MTYAVQVPLVACRYPRPYLVPLYIALIAFTIRAIYVVLQVRTGFVSGAFYAGDSPVYDGLAESLSSGNGFALNGHPTALVTPGYPLFLAGCYWLFGRNLLLVGLLQSALGGLTCAVAFAMARTAFGEETALATGLLCAFMPELVLWTSGQILTEPLYTFLLTLSLYTIMRLLHARSTSGRANVCSVPQALCATTAGVLLSLSALTRPIALGFALCTVLYLWYRAGRKVTVIVSVTVVLIVGVWSCRNYLRLGSWVFTSTEAGRVLFLYHSPHSQGENGGYSPNVPTLEKARDLSELEQDRLYLRAALAYAVEHPGRELVLMGRRFWNLWRPTYAVASWRSRVTAAISYLPLLVFALPAIFSARFREPAVGVLTLFLSYHFLFHLLAAAELRFRTPLEPVLAIFAAAGLTYTLRAFFPGDRTSSHVPNEGAELLDGAAVVPSLQRPLKLSVVVPIYNEAAHIERVLRQVQAVPIPKEVIVVNDGSVDGTDERLTGLTHLYDQRCDFTENRGKGAAIRAGLDRVRGDVVVIQDADGELDPSDYPVLLGPIIREGAQVVFGSRFLRRQGCRSGPSVPWLSRWANWVLTGATNLLFGSRLTDMETGFKMCRPDVLRSLRLCSSRFEFEAEVTAKLLGRQFSIREILVNYYPRARSEKSIGIRDGLMTLWVLARVRLLRR